MEISDTKEHSPTSLISIDLHNKDAGVDLVEQLRSIGCAVLENHEVPIDLLDDVFKEWGKYFSSKDKYKWLRTDKTDEGLIPINFETAKKGGLADFKELYQVHYSGKFPTNIDITSTKKIFSGLVKLGETVCALLDKALPKEVKEQMTMSLLEMISGSNNHLLRVIHYPAVDRGVHIPRAADHTDICLFTTSFGAAFRGLELQDYNGCWYAPKVRGSAIVIFNSEMIEICTRGYFKAVLHRVKANPNNYNSSRYSLPNGYPSKKKN